MKRELILVITASFIFSLKGIEESCPIQAQDERLLRPVVYLPWREEHTVKTNLCDKMQQEEKKECVFCRIKKDDEINDKKNLVLGRFGHNMVLLNLFPYTRGHLLIIPNEHVKRINDLSLKAQTELMWLMGKSVSILEAVGKADGVNIGMNLGEVANASIPDHMHVQVVPRTVNDYNAFLQIIGEARVIFWDMNKSFEELQPFFQQLKFEPS